MDTGRRFRRRSSVAHLARVAAGLPAENAHADVAVWPHRSRKSRIVAAAARSRFSRSEDGSVPELVQVTGLRFPSRIMCPTVAGNRLAYVAPSSVP